MPQCLICDQQDFKIIATVMREGPGKICQCRKCGLVIQDVSQTDKELEHYYNKEYQKTNSLDTGREQTPQDHFKDRLKTLAPILTNIDPLLTPQMRVLEIGCGTGELLYSIKDRVKEVVGVELNKGFVEFMNNDLKIKAYAQDLKAIDFKDTTFDLIISIATLDHLPDPMQTLEAMKKILSPDGKIYLELPNRNEALNFFLPSPQRERFNTFFWHKAHFFYFTQESLARLLDKAGFTSEMTCRHEYTLINYLNWYFSGQPQKSFVDATSQASLFGGNSLFEKDMNEMFIEMEKRFHEIMEKTFRGDILCCVGQIKRT